MELYIRQRLISLRDSYDVYDELGNPRYRVKSDLIALGHQIRVFDVTTGQEVGSIHQRLLSLLPRFEIVVDGCLRGSVRRELSFLRPRYWVDYFGWSVSGDMLGWDYRVANNQGVVMTISKELFHMTDTYILRFAQPEHEIMGLLLVLAIDAAICSSSHS